MNLDNSSTQRSTYHSVPPGRVAIVTDSIAQVPNDLAQQLGIRVMPFSLTVNNEVFVDNSDLKAGDLYQRMRKEKDLQLSTSAPSIGQFYSTFKECFEQGAENILYIGVSSRLSMAINSSEEASRMILDEHGFGRIRIFDSRMATLAQGFLAIQAAQWAQQGTAFELILKWLVEERKRIGFAAGFETLEYLARGGRIGKAAYLLSTAIRILPVISLNEEGEVIPISRPHGYHNMMNDILKYVNHGIAGSRHLSLAVMHADAYDRAEELKALAYKHLHPDKMFMIDFTPVMVAHTGPGIIGLAYHWQP